MTSSQLRLVHRLQIAQQRLHKRVTRSLLDAAGVTMAQAALLALIQSTGPITQKAAAQRLAINESAVTALVDRMVKMNLIVRRRDPDDGRARRLELRPAGRQALQAAREPMRDANERLDALFSEHEIEALAHALNRIAEEFDPVS